MLRVHASAHGPPKEGVMLLQLTSNALDHTCKNVWLRGMGKTEYLWYCNRDKSGFQKNDPRTPVPYPSYQVLTSTWSCAACAPIARIAASEASAIDQSFDQPLRHRQFQSRPNPNWSNLGHHMPSWPTSHCLDSGYDWRDLLTNYILPLSPWVGANVGGQGSRYDKVGFKQWAIYQLDAKEHAQIDGQSSSRCYFTANCQPDPPILGHPVLWGNMSKSKKSDWHFTRMHVGTFQSCALNDFCYILFSVYEKNRPRTQRQPQSLVKNPTSNTIHVLASADTTAAVSRTPVRSPIPITTSL